MINVSQVVKRYGSTSVLNGVDLSVSAGETQVLLGPSGCGKTTMLRLIAGLDRPDTGTISIDGSPVVAAGVWVPPEKRQVGLVFQDWALFPHLSVAGNVGFGLKGQPGRESRVREMLDLVGLGALADRMPATLSGGQQQRVALARSLAPSPRVLLLDEPFSSLDAALRDQLRGELRSLLSELGTTSVFVTHDREEALELGDQLAVLDQGVIVQNASPVELYERPSTPWAARLIGDTNLVPAEATGYRAVSAIGSLHLAKRMTGAVEVMIRPEALTVFDGGLALVKRVRYRGNETLLEVELDQLSLLVRQMGPPSHPVGARVRISSARGELAAWPRSVVEVGGGSEGRGGETTS